MMTGGGGGSYSRQDAAGGIEMEGRREATIGNSGGRTMADGKGCESINQN